MSLFDRWIPYQLGRYWSVLDRETGEIVKRPDGEQKPMPRQWAENEAKQRNQGDKTCKA